MSTQQQDSALTGNSDMPSPGGQEWDVPRQGLGRSALRALAWSALSFGGIRVLSLATTLVLARLLVPEHFGLMAVATVVVNLANMAQDMGVQAALIYRRDNDNRVVEVVELDDAGKIVRARMHYEREQP